MNIGLTLKIEIISSLFGQKVQSYEEGRHRGGRRILSVDEFHLHNLTGKREPGAKRVFIDEKDFFDPHYDYDFTNFSGSDECSRGNELYERPRGWYRMALKVKGKYSDGDAWLGPDGWRSHSVPGEWPVSYHGTSLDGSKGIIRSCYKAGPRAKYGRGIYSTPDIHVAEREEYAKTFKSSQTGKSYKVILQNRINPKKRTICARSDYWLIPVDERVSAEEEKEIVESSIRPYGILIRELNEDEEEDEKEEEQEEEEEVCEEANDGDTESSSSEEEAREEEASDSGEEASDSGEEEACEEEAGEEEASDSGEEEAGEEEASYSCEEEASEEEADEEEAGEEEAGEEEAGDSCEEEDGDSCEEEASDSCEEEASDSCEEEACEEEASDNCEEEAGEEEASDSSEEEASEEEASDSCEEDDD